MKQFIAAIAGTAALIGSPVFANTQISNTTTNAAQNTQSNSGSVNLAPSGGSNANYQINSISNSQFGFAPGITCPTPELAFGAFGGQTNGWGNTGYNTSGNNLGGTVMFTLPIGGDTREYCKQLAKQIALQRELDTDLNMIRQCAVLAREQIQVDLKTFPNFSRCKGVMVNGTPALAEIEEKAVFTPEEQVKPVINVSELP